jgi:hypothetical protein
MPWYRCAGPRDSGKPQDGITYDTMSDDVRAILDTLSLQIIIIVGFFCGAGPSGFGENSFESMTEF